MQPHAAGSSQCSEDGREDRDESLDDELPEVLLGIVAGNHAQAIGAQSWLLRRCPWHDAEKRLKV